jgi:hypothetical protein
MVILTWIPLHYWKRGTVHGLIQPPDFHFKICERHPFISTEKKDIRFINSNKITVFRCDPRIRTYILVPFGEFQEVFLAKEFPKNLYLFVSPRSFLYPLSNNSQIKKIANFYDYLSEALVFFKPKPQNRITLIPKTYNLLRTSFKFINCN